MSWLGRRFPVLRHRDFLLLLADRLIAPGAMAFSIVGVSFAVLDAGGTPADLSYVVAAQLAPCLVFCLLGGVIADRIAPQRVVAASNLLVALGEGTFGILVLTGRPQLWQMMLLEVVTGSGIAMFYPASQALLPGLVPAEELQQASALSRLAMNMAMMSGAAVAGVVVAAVGPGWALTICGAGVTATVPMLLSIKAGVARAPSAASSVLRDLWVGWSEFRSHTWLWVIVAQYCLVMMAWFGGFEVLGPVVAKAHLGGAAAWGAIMAAQSVGLVAGGLLSLWRSPRRPMLAVAGIGIVLALTPLAAGHAVATAAGLPGGFRGRHGHRVHDGGLDGRHGPEHPAGRAGPGVRLRRAGVDDGHPARRVDRRTGGDPLRGAADPVRGGRADRRGVRGGPAPPRRPHPDRLAAHYGR